MHLLDSVFQQFVLVHQHVSVVGSFCIIVSIYQFLHPNLQVLIFQGILLHLNVLFLDLVLSFIQFILGFSQKVAFLLEHIREQFNLLILARNNFELVLGDNLAFRISHGGLFLVRGDTGTAVLYLFLEKNQVLLLESVVLLLKFTDLPLQLLNFLDMLLLDLEQDLVFCSFVLSQLSFSFLNFDNASEEAFVLLENRSSEIGILHHVDIVELSDHGLVLVAIFNSFYCW